MKLAISNIAWKDKDPKHFFELIKGLGCDGVEVAPSCIWDEPLSTTDQDIATYKNMVNDHGLEIVAFQSLLFTKTGCNIFMEKSERDSIKKYIKSMIVLAGKLGVGTLVYGSPPSRRMGDKDPVECHEIAVEFFTELAEFSLSNNTCICIEPLGKSETDFINTVSEGYKFFKEIDSGGFGLHLDTKALSENGEDPMDVFKEHGDVLKHIHISEPGLGVLGSGNVDHALIAQALEVSLYDSYISIEMRDQGDSAEESIINSINYVIRTYLSFQK